MIPQHIQDIFRRWEAGDLGAPTGSTMAILKNDLIGALQSWSDGQLREVVEWCFDNLDGACWGSPEAVERHRARWRAAHEAKYAGAPADD